MNGMRNDPHSPSAGLSPVARDLMARMSRSGSSASKTAKPPITRVPIGKADADAAQSDGRRRGARIFLERAHDAEEGDHHRHRERRVLRVHEHVAVIERAGGEKDERDQAGERAAEAACQPPGDEQADKADRGADQPARLEQTERQNLCGKRGEKVEPAAIHVEIDERQRASCRQSPTDRARPAGCRIANGCSRPSRGRSRER